MHSFGRKAALATLALAMTGSTLLLPAASPVSAADHSEAPIADENRVEDIADVYAFLDPSDNTKMVLEVTLLGFVVPSENVNQGSFDSRAIYSIELEETGDAKVDRTIDVTFSPRTAPTAAQTATVTLPNGRSFTAPTTVPTLADAAPAPVVTTDATSGVSFFAGLTDDPFFFDIVGFNRFVASIKAGSPDVTQLNRGRDSFAGYNVLTIALDVPVAMLNFSGDVIGVGARTELPAKLVYKAGEQNGKGNKFFSVDRMGNPAVNTVLVPFPRKDEYNQSTSQDDAAGKFAADLVASLSSLGTDQAHIGVLAGVAVAKGDLLHVSRAVANSGTGGGNNAGAGFPNGRRPGDDVIDTLLFLVSNEGLTTGDHVDGNDEARSNTFPFLGLSHQPLPAGAEDGTENKN